jgi:signal transduction histidine kinase
MTSLISKLLMIARADRGTLNLNTEYVDVSELTQMIAESHSIPAADRGIRISMDIEPGITAKVDEAMFIRVWDNLLSNSIKYGRENGRIDISLVTTGDHFTGIISDDGIGISAEDLPKIWNRFYQADPSRSDGSGAGLGLAMVKWIITEHGGSISAESEKGKGTRMIFRMPLKQNT